MGLGLPVHRNGDSRTCGASTIVGNQSTVLSNGVLIAVDGDPNSHGGGELISGSNVFIGGIGVINHTPDSARSDSSCPNSGGPHCLPATAGGSPNVFVGDGFLQVNLGGEGSYIRLVDSDTDTAVAAGGWVAASVGPTFLRWEGHNFTPTYAPPPDDSSFVSFGEHIGLVNGSSSLTIDITSVPAGTQAGDWIYIVMPVHPSAVWATSGNFSMEYLHQEWWQILSVTDTTITIEWDQIFSGTTGSLVMNMIDPSLLVPGAGTPWSWAFEINNGYLVQQGTATDDDGSYPNRLYHPMQHQTQINDGPISAEVNIDQVAGIYPNYGHPFMLGMVFQMGHGETVARDASIFWSDWTGDILGQGDYAQLIGTAYGDGIHTSNLDGTSPKLVLDDKLAGSAGYNLIDNPQGIAIGGNKMYWVDNVEDVVRRADLDGTNVETLVTSAQVLAVTGTNGINLPQGIAVDVDGGRVYWSETAFAFAGGPRLLSCDLDGSNILELDCVDPSVAYLVPQYIALDVDAGKIYWTLLDGRIRRKDMDNSGAAFEEVRSGGAGGGQGIALDTNNHIMYWAIYNQEIRRASMSPSLSGVAHQVVTQHQITEVDDLPTSANIRGVALEGNKVYWCNTGDDSIQRKNKDGSGSVEDLITGVGGGAYHLAIAPAIAGGTQPLGTQTLFSQAETSASRNWNEILDPANDDYCTTCYVQDGQLRLVVGVSDSYIELRSAANLLSADTWYALHLYHSGHHNTSMTATEAGDAYVMKLVDLVDESVTEVVWETETVVGNAGAGVTADSGLMYLGARFGSATGHRNIDSINGYIAGCAVVSLAKYDSSRNVTGSGDSPLGVPVSEWTGSARKVGERPGNVEIAMFVRDPIKWVNTYREGTWDWREPDGSLNEAGLFSINNATLGASEQSVQMWLMGDILDGATGIVPNVDDDDVYSLVNSYTQTDESTTATTRTRLIGGNPTQSNADIVRVDNLELIPGPPEFDGEFHIASGGERTTVYTTTAVSAESGPLGPYGVETEFQSGVALTTNNMVAFGEGAATEGREAISRRMTYAVNQLNDKLDKI